MLDVQPIITLLQSTPFQGKVRCGAIDMAGPISRDELRNVETHLPSELLDALLPLLRITSGFDLFAEQRSDGAQLDTPILSIDLARLKPEVRQLSIC